MVQLLFNWKANRPRHGSGWILRRKLRHPVQFARKDKGLLENGVSHSQIGPHPVLGDYIRQVIEDKQSPAVVILR